MDKNQFKESLLLYGADLHSWPEEIMREGLEALEKFPDFKLLLMEQEQFETFLHTRKYEKPSNGFAERIISTSLHKKQKSSAFRSFVSAFTNDFRFPEPVRTAVPVLIILLLVVGFIIGFLNPSESVSTANDETNLQAFLYYEEDIL